MNIRERLKVSANKKEKPTTQLPIWVDNGSESTKLLFEAATKELSRITIKIQEGGLLSIKDKKLILSTIAKNAGRDKSILNKRRQPDLCRWIEAKNTELAISSKDSQKSRGNKENITELKKEIFRLRKSLKAKEQQELRDIVDQFFTSNLLDDRDKLVRDIAKLKVINEELSDKIARLEYRNNELTSQLGKLLFKGEKTYL